MLDKRYVVGLTMRGCRMGAGGVLPGRDPPVRAEIVHESGRTRVTRLFFAGGTVIRKEPLGPDAERRVRHEVAMLERLRGVAGVAQLAEAAAVPGVDRAGGRRRHEPGRGWRSRWRLMS